VFCYWDFGDSSHDASGCTVSHTYRSAGNYSAFVRVSDGLKNRDLRLRNRRYRYACAVFE